MGQAQRQLVDRFLEEVFQATQEAIAVMRGEAKPESDKVRVD